MNLKNLWKKAKTERLRTPEEWNSVIQTLHDQGFLFIDSGPRSHTYAWTGATPKFSVYIYERKLRSGEKKAVIKIFAKNDINCTIYTYGEKLTGSEAKKIIDQTFKRRTKVSTKTAFGVIQYKDKKTFDDYSNKTLGYAKPGYYHRMNKGDISSAYPAAMCGSLPDAHGYKLVNGYVEPNKEYPFAFYMKSGHMSIYQEFNTFDFNKFVLEHTGKKDGNKFVTSFKPLDIFNEQTILMKKSEYELTDEMKVVYNNKYIGSEQQRKDAKQISVAYIGQLRSLEHNTWCYQAHLASVAYCRHLKKMSDLIDEIESVGGTVRHVIVDCIAWEGPRIPSMTKDKYLGAFHEELYKAKYEIWNRNKYQYYINNNRVVKGEEKSNFIRIGKDTDWFIDERWIDGKCIYRRNKNEEIF